MPATATPTAMPAMVLELRPLLRACVLDKVGLADAAPAVVFSAGAGAAETVLMEMMVSGAGVGTVGRIDVISVDREVVDSVEEVEEVVVDVVEEDSDEEDEELVEDVEVTAGGSVVAAGGGARGGGVAVEVSTMPRQ